VQFLRSEALRSSSSSSSSSRTRQIKECKTTSNLTCMQSILQHMLRDLLTYNTSVFAARCYQYHAVSICPSVTFVDSFEMNKHIFNFFYRRIATPF